MSPRPWNLAEEVDDTDESLERARPVLVSLHFIRSALLRRLVICVLSPLLGILIAGVYMLTFPPPHEAEASLILTTDVSSSSEAAVATNVSLLETKTLATRTVAALGLSMTPDEFLDTVTSETVGSQLLELRLSAPNDAEAVRRLNSLTAVYLAFRAEQLSLQSDVLINGLNERIATLRSEIDKLSTETARLRKAGGAANARKLTEATAERGSLDGRIETLQQSVEDATLRNSAVVESSRVLDPPTAVAGRATRNLALGLASGLVGGTALGWGGVLFAAITSSRLRRRSDIAQTIGANVAVSVGRVAAVLWGLRWIPPLRVTNRRRTAERQRLAHAISEELLLPDRSSRLAVAVVDNANEVSFAVAEAARTLAAQGRSVSILDLTERGTRGLRSVLPRGGGPTTATVLRPRGLAPLAHQAADLRLDGHWDDDASPLPSLGEATLVLADLDPAIGADHLTAWTERVVVVLTAGRSSVEKVNTIGNQIRGAGLELRFAAVVRTERTDDSSGTMRTSQSVLSSTTRASDEATGPSDGADIR